MPIYEIQCRACGYQGETLVLSGSESVACPECDSTEITRLMSTPSSLTGKTPHSVPGPNDTSCCGHSAAEAGCAGPGSCCGKNNRS